MAKITQEELLKIAKLSHIAVTDQELTQLVGDIDAALTYVARVGDVVVDSQEQVSKNINIFRDDLVIPTDPERILEQAPERMHHYFVVPMILESNE